MLPESVASADAVSSAPGSRCSRSRSTPSASATSSSASSRGLSQPASRSRSVAAVTASRVLRRAVGTGRLPLDERAGLEPAPLLVGLERRRELVELTGHDGRQVASRDLDAVVRDAVLREVVGADLLGPLAG